MRHWVFLIGLLALFLTASASLAGINKLGSKQREQDKQVENKSVDRILCIDGLKVFQTVAFGFGSGSGAAVSNIQLYEERGGKVVPVRCEEKKKK
ncbi:MAG: hypothetical protein C0617_08990 [Desulfuromonas sp.]|uniref:hypothetical protein n=1 Tax=Desulfuromonas sp. TaxID=892 RepID=UPI000CC3ED13|nr:hypothetical protein [Desulfuromonas sp.]PLX84202.1 MAG: hypothetical protein C0617_08990 [Desulfuromonas sp.]